METMMETNNTDPNNEWWKGDPDPEKITVLILGTFSFILWAAHFRWVWKCYRNLHSLRMPTLGVVSAVGGFAVANAAVDLISPNSRSLFENVEVLCKVFYCYFITRHTLSMFKISGWGSEDENVEAMVQLLEANGMVDTEYTNPCGFAVFWVCAGRKFKPTRKWITGCLRRIQLGIFIIFLEGFVLRRLLENYDLQGGGFAELDYEKGGFYLDLIEVVATMIAVSGTLPLARFYNKVVQPSQTHLNHGGFRMKIFVFFFGWITIVQDMLIGVATVGEWKYHKATVVAIEMIIVQLMVHRGFIGPPFTWNPFRPYIDPRRESILAMMPVALLGGSSVQGQDKDTTSFVGSEDTNGSDGNGSDLLFAMYGANQSGSDHGSDGSNEPTAALDSTPLLQSVKVHG